MASFNLIIPSEVSSPNSYALKSLELGLEHMNWRGHSLAHSKPSNWSFSIQFGSPPSAQIATGLLIKCKSDHFCHTHNLLKILQGHSIALRTKNKFSSSFQYSMICPLLTTLALFRPLPADSLGWSHQVLKTSKAAIINKCHDLCCPQASTNTARFIYLDGFLFCSSSLIHPHLS